MSVLDLLLPKECVGCGVVGESVCPRCWKRWLAPCLEWRPVEGVDWLLSCGPYAGALVQRLIQRWKFAGETSVSRILAGYMQPIVQEGWKLVRRGGSASHWSAVSMVPVPLHSRKQRERGFNQAADLARELATTCGCGLVDVLERRRYTKPQKSCEDWEKPHNIAGAFGLRGGTDVSALSGRDVIVVDDIATSGSTLREAARVLRLSGVRTVGAVVVARG